jgi:hypothetical protein
MSLCKRSEELPADPEAAVQWWLFLPLAGLWGPSPSRGRYCSDCVSGFNLIGSLGFVATLTIGFVLS